MYPSPNINGTTSLPLLVELSVNGRFSSGNPWSLRIIDSQLTVAVMEEPAVVFSSEVLPLRKLELLKVLEEVEASSTR